MANAYDLVVVGAGSAGYAAARTAGALGARVALIDKGPLGGLCILRGCMPSKAILASAEVLHRAQNARGLGLVIPEARADLPAIIARKRHLIREFADYRIEQIHRAPNTEVIAGEARLLDAHHVEILTGPQGGEAGSRQVIEGRACILATGSNVTLPELPGLQETGYLTSDEALDLEQAPRSLIVLGGGFIACELGQFFSRIGVKVTLLLRSGHVLSGEDADVGIALQESLIKEGVEIVNHAVWTGVLARSGRKVVRALVGGHPAEFEAEEILVYTGRHPALDQLGLDAAGVEYSSRMIPVDPFMRTSVPHIYAIGDVTGRFQIVHQAIREAEIAAYNAVSGKAARAIDNRLVPAVVFTDPQVGRVGLTERQAAERGIEVLVGKYPFDDHGKSMCLGRTEGFVKLIGDARTGEILGGAIVGPEGGELLHEIVVAMHFKSTAAEFLQIPHVHPTLAEILTYPAEEIEEQRQQPGPV